MHCRTCCLAHLLSGLVPSTVSSLPIAAFSLLTILSAPLGQSVTALIVLRLLLGFGEGVHIPLLSAITSGWFPVSEQSHLNPLTAHH